MDDVENPEDIENTQDHQFVVEKRSKSAIAANGKASRNSGPKSLVPGTPQGVGSLGYSQQSLSSAFNPCSSFANNGQKTVDSPGKNARRI